MNHAPLLIALQPGLPLGLLATAAVVTASFVSLSIYRYSVENEAWRRTSWMLLAGVTGAFGICGNVDLPVARAQRQRRTKSARSD